LPLPRFGHRSAAWRELMAGELNNAKLLYLVATSRLFAKPMHAAIKGPSSAGKSEIRKTLLRFFPPEVIVSFTSMSERALIYYEEGFEHKIFSMGEAAGADERSFQDYLLRELMSEGVLRYPTATKVGGVVTTVTISKDGPVSFLVTTTKTQLHHENETRMLSLEVDASEGQTTAVPRKVAQNIGTKRPGAKINFETWRDSPALARCGRDRGRGALCRDSGRRNSDGSSSDQARTSRRHSWRFRPMPLSIALTEKLTAKGGSLLISRTIMRRCGPSLTALSARTQASASTRQTQRQSRPSPC